MARNFKISAINASLFGNESFNYFESSVESKSMTSWDFDGGGDLNDFDLSIYEISVMLYEEYESRKAYAAEALAYISNITFTADGKTFTLSDMNSAEIAAFFSAMSVVKNGRKLVLKRNQRINALRDKLGFVQGYNNNSSGPYISINPRSTLTYQKIRVPNTTATNNKLEEAAKLVNINVSSKGISNKKITNITSAANHQFKQIIQRYCMFVPKTNKKADSNLLNVLLLTDEDSDFFPILANTRLQENANDINLFDVGRRSPNLYGYDIVSYSTNTHYKENFIFRSSDLYQEKKTKVIHYASGIYNQQKEYNKNPKGGLDDFGVVDYSEELKSLKNIPIPAAHTSYRPETIGQSDISNEYKLDKDGNATEFFGSFDIAYFRHNIENILKPQVRDAVAKIVDKIIALPVAERPDGFPFTSSANIDFSSKVVADMVSAICDGNDKYFTTSKADGGLGIKLDGDLTAAQFGALKTLSPGVRYYSERQIVERPVWKLVKCHSEEVYYVRANEFYDYSLSGLFHLANIKSTSDPLPASENLFLNKKYKNGEIAGVYNLYNYTDLELRADYTNNYYDPHGNGKPNPPFTANWSTISGNAKIYFYNQTEPKIGSGCYKVYLGILPKDPNLILNYTSLPHYYHEADCSKVPCVSPAATPAPTPTQTTTKSPTQTPSHTKTQTQTQTQTKTSTPTQTQTKTITPTRTQTKTPRRTQTPSESVTPTPTQTETPTRTPTVTPSHSATPTKTPASTSTLTATPTPSESPTRTPTVTPSLTKSQTPSTTKTLSNTGTPTQTQSPTASCTSTPTTTPSVTASVTKTQTPSKSVTQTITSTPSATNTQTQTASVTKTQTQTQSVTHTQTPTASATVTPSHTETPTSTPSVTASCTASPTESLSPEVSPSTSASPTATITPSSSVTLTPTTTNTLTATQTPSESPTQTPTVSPSNTVSPSSSKTPNPTESPTSTPPSSPSPTTTQTPSPSLTATPSTTQTLSATPTPPITGTPTPTTTLTASPTGTPKSTTTPTTTKTQSQTPSTTKTNSATPSETRTPTGTGTPNVTPTSTNTLTATPTKTQTPSKTRTPTPEPSQSKTRTPTKTQTPSKTQTKTQTPTGSQTKTPTVTPTQTRTPSTTRTHTATVTQTASCTASPTVTPSEGQFCEVFFVGAPTTPTASPTKSKP